MSLRNNPVPMKYGGYTNNPHNEKSVKHGSERTMSESCFKHTSRKEGLRERLKREAMAERKKEFQKDWAEVVGTRRTS